MIYLELFRAFFEVGTFSFGGAYGAIPLMREVVLSHGWITEETFTYFVAVSESTPGPIMANLATFIGREQAGFAGALLATVSVVLPSFIMIMLVVTLMKNLIKNQYVQAVLRGIKPCFIGLDLSMGAYMVVSNLFSVSGSCSVDWRVALMTVILLVLPWGYGKVKGKDLSPITLILLSTAMGILAYGI